MTEFPKHIFRSYDIRGLLEEVTPDIARAVGTAVVGRTQAKTVVVGRDMRSTSEVLQRAAIEGVIAMGANAVDVGLCSTSMFNFAVSSQTRVDAGIMITASHNPPQYNGIKAADHTGMPFSGVELLELIEQGSASAQERGTVSKYDVTEAYVDRCVEGMDVDVSTAKLVIDYGNGMGALSMRPLCERLGLKPIELFPDLDARFPNHEPNPAVEKNLDALKAAVVRERADFGVALDGDADRIGFVDDEGHAYRGDQILALLASDVLVREPGAKIVVAPNQSWSVFEAIAKGGGEAVKTKIGRTNAIRAMAAHGAALGGEVSGHFFFRKFARLEAVDYAFARVLGMWKRSGKTFSELMAPQRVYHNTWEVNLEIHDKERAIKAIQEQYASGASVVDRLDGIRCEFGHDWWFIVRPSNTEPLIRLIVEATDESFMARKCDELVALIKRHA